MFKVFVSYSSYDLSNVEVLQRSLVETGVEVFVAEHSVHPGEELSERISSAIAACDMFVLLWSANAKASEWVSQEIGKAHSLNKQILPLVFDEGLRLPGFIGGLKYLPVYKDPVAAVKHVRKLVLDLYNKQAEHEKQKRNESFVLLGLGALCLWVFSQK